MACMQLYSGDLSDTVLVLFYNGFREYMSFEDADELLNNPDKRRTVADMLTGNEQKQRHYRYVLGIEHRHRIMIDL